MQKGISWKVIPHPRPAFPSAAATNSLCKCMRRFSTNKGVRTKNRPDFLRVLFAPALTLALFSQISLRPSADGAPAGFPIAGWTFPTGVLSTSSSSPQFVLSLFAPFLRVLFCVPLFLHPRKWPPRFKTVLPHLSGPNRFWLEWGWTLTWFLGDLGLFPSGGCLFLFCFVLFYCKRKRCFFSPDRSQLPSPRTIFTLSPNKYFIKLVRQQKWRETNTFENYYPLPLLLSLDMVKLILK